MDPLEYDLHQAGDPAELYLAGGSRMLFGWRTDRPVGE